MRGRSVHGAGPQQRRRAVAVGAPQGVRVHAPHRSALWHRRDHYAGEARHALRLHLRQIRRRPERYRGPRRVPRGDEEDHARHRRRPRLLPYPDGPRRRPQQSPPESRGSRSFQDLNENGDVSKLTRHE